MVQIIPGPEQVLAPAFAQLAQGVARLINPNHDFQMQMREAVTKDPALAQHLADLEDTSPGTLEALGFGKLGKVISKLPISQSAMIERSVRPQLENVLNDKSLTTAAATKEVVGKTPQELQQEQATLAQTQATTAHVTQATTNLGMENQLQESELQQKQRAEKDLSNADEFIKQNPNQSVPNIVNKMIDGTIPIGAQTGLFNSPYGPAIKAEFERQVKLMDYTELAKLRRTQKSDDKEVSLERLRQTQAFTVANELSVPMNAAYDYLHDPAATQRARDLLLDPSKAKTDQDKGLLAVAQGFRARGGALQLQQIQKSNATINTLTQRLQDEMVKGRDPDTLGPTYVNDINEQLAAKNAVTGNDYKAVYGNLPDSEHHLFGFTFGGSKGIYYTNGGKPVESSEATQSESATPDPIIASKFNQAMHQYQSLQTPQEKTTFLIEVKKRNPIVYNKLSQAVGGQ